MRKTSFRWIILFLIVALIVPLGTWALPSHAQQTTTLPIGYLGSADDDLAQGLQLAINEINEAGGIDAEDGVTYTFSLEFAALDPDDPNSVQTALEGLSRVIAIFGPSDDSLIEDNISALSAADAPVFAPSQLATLNQQDTSSNIFRLIAPETAYAQALANYLAFELGLQDIVLLQTPSPTLGNGLNNISAALTTFNVPPTQSLQVTDNVQLENTVVTIANLNPEAVVAFGPIENAAAALESLRNGGWDGLFVYPDARAIFESDESEDFELDEELFAGVITADSWSFSTPTSVGRTFVANYVAAFGEVPGALSVAGYDAAYALSILVRDESASPDGIKTGLAQLRLPNLVGGPISPALYGNRILSQTVYVIVLTGNGGADTLAIYDNGVQRAGIVDDTVIGSGGSTGGSATQATPATATLAPTATVSAPATATPSFLVATVRNTVAALNVRTGPGTVYPEVDELSPGQQVTVVGRNEDFRWLFVQFGGLTGWISAEFVDIFDPGNLYAVLPIIPSPATPTPTATQGPVEPDLIITNVTISPTDPQPGSAITATVTIQNQGATNAGAFAVATSFRPGEIYTAQNVSGLAAGQTLTVTLTNTVTQTGYVPDLAIIVDLNEQVAEGSAGESNNVYTVAYKVDRSVATQNSIALTGIQSFNFLGTNNDVTWDGNTFTMLGNARIGQLTGVDFQTAHYDQVAGAATSTAFVNPQPGQIFAIITDENQSGIIRIDNRNGATIGITYRIYN